jgi:hypothetical protein
LALDLAARASNPSSNLNIRVECIAGFFVAVFLPPRPRKPIWVRRDELTPALSPPPFKGKLDQMGRCAATCGTKLVSHRLAQGRLRNGRPGRAGLWSPQQQHQPPRARCSATGPHELWQFKRTGNTRSQSMIEEAQHLPTAEGRVAHEGTASMRSDPNDNIRTNGTMPPILSQPSPRIRSPG